MIDEILPPTVAAEEAFADPEGIALYAEEDAVVSCAVAKRRTEFATVRHCARAALRRLGMAPGPILPGERGAPRWPSGIVGSMTHCTGYRAAAAAHDRDIVTIGIDAEPHDDLPAGVLDAVTVHAERSMLSRLRVATPDVCWDRLLFCAKESVYKAWFPLTEQWLDFTGAEVVIDPEDGRFVANLLVPGPTVAGRQLQYFDGRYIVRNGLVLTAIAVVA